MDFSKDDSSSEWDENDLAPDIDIEDQRIITVEHPGIIENTDRAVASLGGRKRLQEFLVSSKSRRSLDLHLEPDTSCFRRPIESAYLPTSNMLLEVELPKMIGRKRKRGPDGQPGELEPIPYSVTQQHKKLLRSLLDNVDDYELRVIGEVNETRRFIDLPDLQYSLAESKLAAKVKDGMPLALTAFEPGNFTLVPSLFQDLHPQKRLRPFSLDADKRGNPDDVEITVTPSLLFETVQSDYQYSMSIYNTETIDDAGHKKLSNRARTAKTQLYMLDSRSSHVPTHPKPSLPSEYTLNGFMKHLITDLRAIFVRRPINTRRAMLNMLPEKVKWDLRYGIQYCVYAFKTGPWKDTYIKLGTDPRTDPLYRKYQAVVVRLGSSREKIAARRKFPPKDRFSHLFTGETACFDSSTWIIDDITDPLIRRIVDNATPAETCEPREDGWFQNCTMAKIRYIVRDKVRMLLKGQEIDDSKYDAILELPETAHELPKDIAKYRGEDQEMMTAFRIMLKLDPRVYPEREPQVKPKSPRKKKAA